MEETFEWEDNEEQTMKGLEDLSFSGQNYSQRNDFAGSQSEEDNGGNSKDWSEDDDHGDGAFMQGGDAMRIGINSKHDIDGLDLVRFSPHMIEEYDFASVDLAYKFYCSYAKIKWI